MLGLRDMFEAKLAPQGFSTAFTCADLGGDEGYKSCLAPMAKAVVPLHWLLEQRSGCQAKWLSGSLLAHMSGSAFSGILFKNDANNTTESCFMLFLLLLDICQCYAMPGISLLMELSGSEPQLQCPKTHLEKPLTMWKIMVGLGGFSKDPPWSPP